MLLFFFLHSVVIFQSHGANCVLCIAAGKVTGTEGYNGLGDKFVAQYETN